MATTKIEWCDRVWNPVRGCSVISPGCHHCYAMRQAHRFSKAGLPFEGLTKQTSAGPQWTGAIRLIENALLEPLSWRNPQRIFVNSMSDLFHEDVPDAFLDRVMTVMALSSWHTFQVLTKRADRMRSYLKALTLDRIVALANAQADGSPANLSVHDNLTTIARRAREHAYRDEPHRMPRRLVLPLPNAWFGVSVEDQKRADERIPQLLETPAAVRFISAEPLLGPLTGSDQRPRDHQAGRRQLRRRSRRACPDGRPPVRVRNSASCSRLRTSRSAPRVLVRVAHYTGWQGRVPVEDQTTRAGRRSPCSPRPCRGPR
jgi:protein gp37